MSILASTNTLMTRLFTNASDMAAVFERYDSAHDRPVVVMGDGRQALDCLRSLVGRTQATLDVRLDGLGSPILPRTFAGRSHTIVIAGPDSETICEEGRSPSPQQFESHLLFWRTNTPEQRSGLGTTSPADSPNSRLTHDGSS